MLVFVDVFFLLGVARKRKRESLCGEGDLKWFVAFKKEGKRHPVSGVAERG